MVTKGRISQQRYRNNSTILQPQLNPNQTDNVSFHREVQHAFASQDGIITEAAKTDEDQ